MEERNIVDVVKDAASILKEVKEYILNTEHYIFYWIANQEIKDYIEEYPDDFEDRINISVESLRGNSVTVSIEFTSTHPHNHDYIDRYCVLSTFRDTVKAKYAEFGGSVIQLMIKEAEEQLDYYEEQVEKTKKEIEELKKKL